MNTGVTVLYLQIIIFVQYSTEVDGAEFMPIFDITPINVTVIQGRSVFLNCTVDYVEDYQVAWLNPENKVLTNKDKRIIDDIRITFEHHKSNEWNLNFRNVQHSDEGVYSCSINTIPVQTKRVYLRVLVPPKIIPEGSSQMSITALEGTTVQLVCNATGIPTPSVQWFRHISGTSFEKATTEAVVEPGEVLLIHNISRYCGGEYECVAFNNVEERDSYQIHVEVVFRPEIELPTKRLSQFLEKETILQCLIRANPLISSEWQRNGRRLESGRKYRIDIYDHYSEIYTKVLDLNIKNVEKDDYGNYTCVAFNNLGEDKETMVLYELIHTTKAPSTEKVILSTPVQFPPYEVYDERTILPHKQNTNVRPRPEIYRSSNSGHNNVLSSAYILLLFISLHCLLCNVACH